MRFLDWLSYPRGVVVSVLGAIWTFIMSIVVLVIAFATRSRRLVDMVIQQWSWPLIYFSGLTVERRGAESVQHTPKGFLILFNHSSYFDIPILFAYFPRSLRFGAKIELFKVPFFGRAMRACGMLPIDRRNRNKVMQVYQEAITRVNKGEVFALAPEGTRQNQPVLGPFKRGPFEFAIHAEMDIVPVVLAGAFAALSRDQVLVNLGRWRRKVVMEILPPVPTKGITIETVETLAENVRAQMALVHDRLYAELGPQT